jgi:hypothetical protein
MLHKPEVPDGVNRAMIRVAFIHNFMSRLVTVGVRRWVRIAVDQRQIR